MRVSVIGDVHCQGPNDPAQQKFLQWISDLDDVDELWILGDLVHFGWAFGSGVHPMFAEVIDALRLKIQSGIHILFVPGNHDFGLSQFFAAELGIEVRDAHIRNVDGTRIALLHGDELDTSMTYSWFRRFIRSRGFAVLINCLGPRLGTALLKRMAGEVSVGGDLWPSTRTGMLQWLEDADLVLMGHVHTPWVHRGEEGAAVVLTPGEPVFIEDGRLVTAPPA